MNVLICDDHRLFSDALAALLEARGWRVVATVTDPLAAAQLARREVVDLCLMDLHFPSCAAAGGPEGVQRVLDASPSTRVVILTGSVDEDLIAAAVGAGAQGFAPKDTDVDVLSDIMHRVVAGEAVLRNETLRRAIRGVSGRRAAEVAASFLTPRERQFLELLVRGRDTGAIATELGVRQATARTHVQNLLTKLGVHTRLEASAFAVANKLVPPCDPSP